MSPQLIPFVALGSLLAISAGGCSMVFTFEVVGTVRSAVDGQPLSDVRVSVNTRGEKDRSDFDQATTSSEPSGEFKTGTFRVSGGAFGPNRAGWLLKLEKKGFVTEYVPIKPGKEPASNRDTIPIFAVIHLRPER